MLIWFSSKIPSKKKIDSLQKYFYVKTTKYRLHKYDWYQYTTFKTINITNDNMYFDTIILKKMHSVTINYR